MACQYTGTAGDTAVNCQVVGVFLAYASNKGAAFIDRAALYVPEEWANDPKRRTEAGVPGEIAFENKIELAKRMLERAFGAAAVPARWVAADSFYGRSHELRAWLEEHGRAYAVSWCPRPTRFRSEGAKRRSSGSLERLAERLGEDAMAKTSNTSAVGFISETSGGRRVA